MVLLDYAGDPVVAGDPYIASGTAQLPSVGGDGTGFLLVGGELIRVGDGDLMSPDDLVLAGLDDVLTDQGDLLYRDAGGVTRLPLGGPGEIPISDGDDLVYRTLISGDLGTGSGFLFSNDLAMPAEFRDIEPEDIGSGTSGVLFWDGLTSPAAWTTPTLAMLGSFSSADLAGALTDETGWITGAKAMFSGSPNILGDLTFNGVSGDQHTIGTPAGQEFFLSAGNAAHPEYGAFSSRIYMVAGGYQGMEWGGAGVFLTDTYGSTIHQGYSGIQLINSGGFTGTSPLRLQSAAGIYLPDLTGSRPLALDSGKNIVSPAQLPSGYVGTGSDGFLFTSDITGAAEWRAIAVADLPSMTSAELATILSDELGSSGGFVRGTGSTLTNLTLAGTITTPLTASRIVQTDGSSLLTTSAAQLDAAFLGTGSSGFLFWDGLTTQAYRAMVASDISSGTIATARLGSGTANSGAFLRGDSTWTNILAGPLIADNSSNSAVFYLYNAGDPLGGLGLQGWSGLGSTNDVTLTTIGANNLIFGTNDTDRGRITGSGLWQIESLSASLPVFTNASKQLVSVSTIPTAVLGSGTANSTTVLRGDQTWANTVTGDWNVGGTVYANGNLVRNTAGAMSFTSAGDFYLEALASGSMYFRTGGTVGASLDAAGLFTATNLAASGLTASKPVLTNSSKQLISLASQFDHNFLGSGGSAGVLLWDGLTDPATWSTVPVSLGGTGVTSAFTAGSVIFSNGSALAQDNANLFFDYTTGKLGIGTSSPGEVVQVNHATRSLAKWSRAGSALGWIGEADALIASAANTDFAFLANSAIYFGVSGGALAGKIHSSGRWLLGTTTDDGSSRLQVSGNILTTGIFDSNDGSKRFVSGVVGGTPLIGTFTNHAFFVYANASQAAVFSTSGDFTATRSLISNGGGVYSYGATAGYNFFDRDDNAQGWLLYSDADVARLYRGGVGDMFTVNASGDFTASRYLYTLGNFVGNASGSLQVGSAGDLYLDAASGQNVYMRTGGTLRAHVNASGDFTATRDVVATRYLNSASATASRVALWDASKNLVSSDAQLDAAFIGTGSSGYLHWDGITTQAYQSIPVADLPSMSSADLVGKLTDETGWATGAQAVFSLGPVFTSAGGYAASYHRMARSSTGAYDSGDIVLNLANTNSTDNNWTQVQFSSSGGSIAAGIAVQNIDHGNAYGEVAVFTRAASGWGERLRITGTGIDASHVGSGIFKGERLGTGSGAFLYTSDVTGPSSWESESSVRTILGLVIGTNVQAWDADLDALAGLTTAADKVPYFTGSHTAALADFTSTGRSIVASVGQIQGQYLGTGTGAFLFTSDVSGASEWRDLEAADIGSGSGGFLIWDGVTDPPAWTSAAGALAALTPLTTRGDILYHNATVTTRLALGTVGKIPISDGTDLVYRLLVAGDIPSLAASIITSGIFTPTLLAGGTNGVGKVIQCDSSGDPLWVSTLTTGVIPSLATTKITSGTFDAARLGSGSGFLFYDGVTTQSFIDATSARANLGLVIGTDVQAYDPELAALAGLTSAANKVPYFTGSAAAALASVTGSFGNIVLSNTPTITTPTLVSPVTITPLIDYFGRIGPAVSNAERGPWNPTIYPVDEGRALCADEEFTVGTNSVVVYDTGTGSHVSITRQTGDGSEPNESGKWLKISYDGNTAAGPGAGGFSLPWTAARNTIFVLRFVAKIPVGKTLATNFGSQGTNATAYWLTGNIGTGLWEEYCVVSHCGNTGSFSTGGQVYIVEDNAAFDWYLARAQVFRIERKTLGTGLVLRSGSTPVIVAQAVVDQAGAGSQSAYELKLSGVELRDSSTAIEFTVPCACVLRAVTYQVKHGEASDPGDWDLQVDRNGGATTETQSFNMDQVSWAANDGTMAFSLSFSAGDRFYAVALKGGSSNVTGMLARFNFTFYAE